MRTLVTGGTGFIGSHQVVALLEAGHEVDIVDNAVNSHPEAVVDRISAITGHRPQLHQFDVRATADLADLLVDRRIDAVLHFAAHKQVEESVRLPLKYYRNNIDGLASVIEAGSQTGVKQLVFSSSGSVYGAADTWPIPESAPHRPTNPYSATKSIGEQMLQAVCLADPAWQVMALRYFNPAGAHPSGELGEDPAMPSKNLLPLLMAVAVGNIPAIEVCGDDFDTIDGTGVRDYVHVVDVAVAHLRALEVLPDLAGFEALNIGRGEGVSVLQLIDAVRSATGRAIDTVRAPRRDGDVAVLFADTSAASARLGQISYRSLAEICVDAWRWQSMNPEGYVPDALAAGSSTEVQL